MMAVIISRSRWLYKQWWLSADGAVAAPRRQSNAGTSNAITVS